jgi:hypothetical protein
LRRRAQQAHAVACWFVKQTLINADKKLAINYSDSARFDLIGVHRRLKAFL